MVSSETDPGGTNSLIIAAKDLVSLGAFQATSWVLVAICTSLFVARIYVRYMCFGRLLLDDYLMGFAWAALVVTASLGQVYLRHIYMLMAVINGESGPTATFFSDLQHGVRLFGIVKLFSLLGIWAIKMNFLLFFKRLATSVRALTMLWWVVVGVTISFGIVSIALMQFWCIFGDLHTIMQCTQLSIARQTFEFFRVSCILDVISDALIMIFPVVVLWKVQLTLRKKLILFAIFSLVLFTIAVTIVRGSIFGGSNDPVSGSEKIQLNITWVWFWFFIEHSISLTIACFVSFRALFTYRKRTTYQMDEGLRAHTAMKQAKRQSGKGAGFSRRVKHVHDSILETFKDSEAIDYEVLPMPESGRLSPTFITEIGETYVLKTTS